MKSQATNAKEYLASLPADRRVAVEAVREVILKNLDKDYEECMVWGVLGYAVPQRVFPAGHHTDPKKPLMMCGVSSQKNDLVVYLMNVFGGGGGLGGDPALRAWFEKAWAKAGAGMPLCVSGAGGGGCCIRFKKLEDLALDVIGEAVRRTPAKAFVGRYLEGLGARGKARPKSSAGKGEPAPRETDAEAAPSRKRTPPKTQAAAKKSAKAPPARMSLDEVMSALEKAGSAQTRKTYARHGACEPLFGVQFGTLKKLVDRIKIDQELAEALWETGNFDARNLAAKIVDPVNISSKVLDRWAATPIAWVWGGYVGQIAAEGPRGREKAERWLKAKNEATRSSGWCAVAALAMIDESLPDAWFAAHLVEIERTIHAAPNRIRSLMNRALIAIGCRNAALRKAANATDKRLGEIEVDLGDTDCKTPRAIESIDKAWTRAKSAGFESPAAQERSRESMRTRC